MTDPLDRSPESGTDDAITRSRMERLKAQQAGIVGRVERTRQRLEESRPKSRFLDTVFGALESDVAAGGGVLAGAVAFRVFLFLVPYVFLGVTVFGLGASAANEDPSSLARDNGIGGLAAKALAGVNDLSTGERILSFLVVGFALLLATRALLKVLRIVHALIWHTRAGKPASASRAAGALVLIVTLALMLAALVGAARGESFILGLLMTLLYVAIPVGAWLFVSWHMPHPPDVPWTAFVPGALFFGVGLEGLHLVTVYWIAREVENKTDTYGAIGFALALLLWAYLLGRLITTSAVINETLWTRYQARRRARPGAHATSAAVGDQAAGYTSGDAGRLRSEDGRTQREDEYVAGDEGHDPGVEAGLRPQRRDDQGELPTRQDRGGQIGGGGAAEPSPS